MKPKIILPPLLALVAAIAFLGFQGRSIHSLELKTAELRKRISDSAAPSDALSLSSQSREKASDQKPFNWKEVASKIVNGEISGRPYLALEKRLRMMTVEELFAALDEIAAADIGHEARETLEYIVAERLGIIDPEAALERFSDRLRQRETGISWRLSQTWQDWAKKDLEKATAWLDGKIADGTLDGRAANGTSVQWQRFEAAFIHLLLSSDPATASRRLAAFSESERSRVLFQFSERPINEEDQAAFGQLVRELIPKKDQKGVLSDYIEALAPQGDFDKITHFLNQVNATSAERAALVERAINPLIRATAQKGKISRDNIDSLRQWASIEAPEDTDKITGAALARATNSSNPLSSAEAEEMVDHYQKSSGSDEVMISFLGNLSAIYEPEFRRLAEKISDVKRRQQILQRFDIPAGP